MDRLRTFNAQPFLMPPQPGPSPTQPLGTTGDLGQQVIEISPMDGPFERYDAPVI
jgi:hypothetical protein